MRHSPKKVSYTIVFELLLIFSIFVKLNFTLNAVFTEKIRIALSVVILTYIISSKLVFRVNEFFCFVTAFVYVAGVSVVNHNMIGQVLSYILLFMVVLMVSHHTVSKRFLLWISVASFFLYMRFILYGDHYEAIHLSAAINESNIYLNPNMIGGFIFILLIFVGLYIRTQRIKNERLLFFFVCCLALLFEYFMKDRTMMVGIGLLYLLSWDRLLSLLNSEKKIKFVVTAAFIFSVALPFIVTTNWYDQNWEIVRSLLSGRDYVWYKYFQILDGSIVKFFFGLGAAYEDAIKGSLAYGSSMHNGFFQMILYFGFVSVVLLYAFFMIQIKNTYQKEVHSNQVFVFVSIVLILVVSSVEIMLQQSTYSMYIACLLGMAVEGKALSGRRVCADR